MKHERTFSEIDRDQREMAKQHLPLQVVSVNLESSEVSVSRENLEIIQKNLQDEKVDKISVVSVMGSYRTGKSFLLDLFLKYLDYEALSAEFPIEDDILQQKDRETGAAFKIPGWLANKKQMTEDLSLDKQKESEESRGFHWRGGAAKCTEGIWIWSRPFVKTITVQESRGENEDGEEIIVKRKIKVGLLLMDTQGAFDSQTTKQQSATIFGLTTALSSKQLYNIQGRIGADHIEHLHYFAEMAVAACRSGVAGGSSSSTSGPATKPFQYLQLVVRDW